MPSRFEKDTGIRVRHVAPGEDAALKTAEKGNIGAVMAHAKALAVNK